MTQVLIDRATLDQIVVALNNAEDALNNSQALIAGRERFGFAKPCYAANEIALGFVSPAITAGRAALANESTKSAPKPGFHDCTFDAAPQAQQVEPTDDQLVKGVKAMRLFVTKNSVADFKLGYMAALAAAPAPQAQDKSDNYLSGYCTGRTDLLKEQSAQPAQGVPEVGFGNMQSAQPVAQQDHIPDAGEMVLSDDEILTIAHRKATRYTHAVAPGQVTYGFAVAHLLDFVRAVLEEKTAQPVAQPLPDPCHTCAHYQQGKLPGVRIHDETCYECRSYWGNKWEAA